MNTNKLPILAVTVGDVAGIGPEITARMLLNHPDLRSQAKFVVIGDVASLQKAAVQIGHRASQVVTVDHPDQVRNQPDTIEVIQVGDSLGDVPLGQLNARAGAGAAHFVLKACDLARQGHIHGIVTAPLNKEALHMGGFPWPGHTELLAHEFGVKDFSLVLSHGDLYVFHLTTHVSMQQAIQDCTPQRFDQVFTLIKAFQNALHRSDNIAVCGLNPHAGENGLFGTEEQTIIEPAIQRAQKRGIPVVGPFPTDALWPKVVKGLYQFVVCCYHDQGHGPFKAVYGTQGVNITVGLPVVRVSVDHGTAFDIAGQNLAHEDSLIMAAERAASLSLGWKEVWEVAKSQVNG